MGLLRDQSKGSEVKDFKKAMLWGAGLAVGLIAVSFVFGRTGG